MADKKSNEPRRENGRIPTYQTAYHGAKKKDPLTNLARIIVEKFDKRRVPENTIDTIPFDQIYPDGLCRIGDNFYSKMVQFYDINYQLAQNDEKQHIFAEYCQFLNYFDETIHFQFCFINQRVDMEEYKKVISIPDQDDEFNVVRREYATYLRNQLEKGNNGIVKSKYLVFGIEARDRKQAVSRLAKIESDVINKFKLLGCKCVPVNGLERLRIMHDYLNQDSLEKFAMKSFKDVVESGLTPKNFITPTSFDFRAKDYYKIGDMFATTNFLVISAPEISDEMLADILNMEDALSVTMHIDTLNQTEAMKYIKGKLSDINKMKIEEQKKAIRSGYDMDIIPPDIETYSEEAHGLLKEMQSRNERLFKVTFLITSFNENLQKMKDFRFTLSNNIQSANCALRKLDHQQEQGLISSLPLGKNFIKQKRYLTTSSTAVFVPFTTQELFMDSKESLYMGLNSLSNGMIMADRKLLKNPNGLILGTPGSGKSFATKREILNTFLVTTDDILICDPEAEYYPLVNYLGGQVIKIGQSSKHYINPLDINLNYSDDDDPVSLKADFILSFMELVVGGKTGLKPEEKSAIDFAVSRIYTKYFENPVPENMPILQDLYNELLSHKEDLVSQHIAQCMYLYVEGSNNLFNHHTNVDLDNRIICFDIKSLGKTLKKLGMLVVQDAVWNRVTVNREMHKFTRFYIDEFHLLLKDELTAAYSMEIWKRFRKWGGIPTGITQNVKDFLASKEIENIFDNSDFVYMLNQGADDRDILAQKLDISQHQIKYVTNVGQGEGLIFFGDIVQPFVDRFPKDTLMYGLSIVVKKPNISTFLQGIGITICGIPVALVLSALAAFMSSAGVDTSEDVTIYPIWLSLIAFAVVPAIVEEYVFRGVILGAYLQIEERAAVFISSLFFAMLHFSLGSVMYGFMYGCIFALVRVATGNLIYSVAMHGVFNMVNVAMAYIGITMVPGWIVLLAFSVGLAGFIILLIVFFKKNPVSLSKSSFKRRQLITREGYITLIICLCVTVMLLMM